MAQIRIHGGNLIEAGEKYQIPEDQLIDFSANINPLGPPEIVYQTIQANLKRITQYPDSRNIKLKQVLADHLRIPAESILLGNGASELIFLIVNTLRPKQVFLAVPTFSEYEIASRAAGADIIRIPLQGEAFNRFSFEQLRSMKKGDLFFICNPNNPTGQLYNREFLFSLLARINQSEAFLVIDESFLDFLENKAEITMMMEIKHYQRLMILYSLTKFFAIPGLRLGALVSDQELIANFDLARDPWNINVFAQLAGIAALMDRQYIQNTLEFFSTEKRYFFQQLQKIKGIKPFEPSANYIFIQLLGSLNSSEITEALAKEGILVRNLSSYPLLGEKYLRVAIKSRKENDLFLQNFRNLLRREKND